MNISTGDVPSSCGARHVNVTDRFPTYDANTLRGGPGTSDGRPSGRAPATGVDGVSEGPLGVSSTVGVGRDGGSRGQDKVRAVGGVIEA